MSVTPELNWLLKPQGKIKAENVTLKFDYPSNSQMRAYLIKDIPTDFKDNLFSLKHTLAAKTGEIEIIIWSAVNKKNVGKELYVTVIPDASNQTRKEPSSYRFPLNNLSQCK